MNKLTIILITFTILAFVLSACGEEDASSIEVSEKPYYSGTSSQNNYSDISSYYDDNNGEQQSVTQQPTYPITQPDSQSVESTDEQISQPQATAVQLEADMVVGQWQPISCENSATGKPASLIDAFGKAFASYGGLLELKQDGTFYVYIGAYKENDANTGTYSLSQGQITVQYNNGVSDIFTYAEKDGQKCIMVPLNGYIVTFVAI